MQVRSLRISLPCGCLRPVLKARNARLFYQNTNCSRKPGTTAVSTLFRLMKGTPIPPTPSILPMLTESFWAGLITCMSGVNIIQGVIATL